jgi:hypothetical protein
MANSLKHPCRLAVFLAREVPVAVILRRGPNQWAQLVSWDRKTDRMTPGQWFHGQVYARRCDLSPDGRLFVYFAAKHGRPKEADEDEIGEAWTAVSRPPYFTALALWTNLGSWYGGGAFESAGKLLLDTSCGLEPHPKYPVKGLRYEHIGAATAPWERRLLLAGWRLVERGFDPRTHRRVGARELWEKLHPGLPIKLCREIEEPDFQRYGGPYGDTFWLESKGDLQPLDRVTFAEWDGAERLVFVRQGKLYEARIAGRSLGPEAELYDFNPLSPEEVTTPDWAKRW